MPFDVANWLADPRSCMGCPIPYEAPTFSETDLRKLPHMLRAPLLQRELAYSFGMVSNLGSVKLLRTKLESLNFEHKIGVTRNWIISTIALQTLVSRVARVVCFRTIGGSD